MAVETLLVSPEILDQDDAIAVAVRIAEDHDAYDRRLAAIDEHTAAS